MLFFSSFFPVLERVLAWDRDAVAWMAWEFLGGAPWWFGSDGEVLVPKPPMSTVRQGSLFGWSLRVLKVSTWGFPLAHHLGGGGDFDH